MKLRQGTAFRRVKLRIRRSICDGILLSFGAPVLVGFTGVLQESRREVTRGALDL